MAVALRQSRSFDSASPVTRYWLANCAGFSLTGGAHGTVEDILAERDPHEPTALVVRSGRHRTKRLPTSAIVAVVPADRVLVVERSESSAAVRARVAGRLAVRGSVVTARVLAFLAARGSVLAVRLARGGGKHAWRLVRSVPWQTYGRSALSGTTKASRDLFERLVAPPYDVISPEQRSRLGGQSPFNVVHLTLPESEDEAGALLAGWRERGVLARDPEPAYWWLAQEYVGPDGVARRREGFVASLRAEPYERRVILPHERTHAGPKEGRLRLLRATRTQVEPLFFLWDGTIEVDGLGEPDLEADEDGVASRLWRLDAEFGDALTEELADAQLLIADGHHRYETTLAYHDEAGDDASAWLMAVIVPTDQEGLTIFPTHRIAASAGSAAGTPIEPPGDELPGPVLYRGGRYELLAGDGLDPEVVESFRPEGVTYTPQREEAVAAVDRGDAEAAFLLRPTRIEDVWEVARRGDVMPQKSTFFYPKLTSGLLMHPLD